MFSRVPFTLASDMLASNKKTRVITVRHVKLYTYCIILPHSVQANTIHRYIGGMYYNMHVCMHVCMHIIIYLISIIICVMRLNGIDM